MGRIRAIGPDGDVIGAECPSYVVDMVEHRADVSLSAQEMGDVCDAHRPARVDHGLDGFVVLAADVLVQAGGAGVTDHDRALARSCGIKASNRRCWIKSTS